MCPSELRHPQAVAREEDQLQRRVSRRVQVTHRLVERGHLHLRGRLPSLPYASVVVQRDDRALAFVTLLHPPPSPCWTTWGTTGRGGRSGRPYQRSAHSLVRKP